jgi:hypothetical protein
MGARGKALYVARCNPNILVSEEDTDSLKVYTRRGHCSLGLGAYDVLEERSCRNCRHILWTYRCSASSPGFDLWPRWPPATRRGTRRSDSGWRGLRNAAFPSSLIRFHSISVHPPEPIILSLSLSPRVYYANRRSILGEQTFTPFRSIRPRGLNDTTRCHASLTLRRRSTHVPSTSLNMRSGSHIFFGFSVDISI